MDKITKDNIEEISSEFAVDGRAGNRSWRDKGRECRNFIKGKQWDQADVDELEDQGVTAITVNHCLPIRDNLCGREQQNRKDITCRPNKGGTLVAARLLTAEAKHAMTQSNAVYEKSEMFKNGIGVGRGFLTLDVEFDNDPFNGDLVVESWSPFDCDPDPLIKEYDPNKTGRYFNLYKWINKEEVEAKYPDKAEELKNASDAVSKGNLFSQLRDKVKQLLLGDANDDWMDEDDLDEDGINPSDYRYRVRKCWLFGYEEIYYWLDREHRSVMKLTESKQISRAKESAKYLPERFEVKRHIQKILYKTYSVGNVLLDWKRDPFKFAANFSYDWPENGKVQVFETKAVLPVVPFYPYFEDGETFGKIENIIGPQIEENKRRTQALRIINSVANSGWISEEGSLSPEMQDMLRDFGARPGLLVEYARNTNKPSRIEPPTAPTAHLMSAMQSKEDMKEISNVNNESLAYETPSGMSGYAIALKQSQGAMGNEIIFGNFDQSSILFAQLLIEVIRCGDFYSEVEIQALMDEADFIDGTIMKKAVQVIGEPPIPPAAPNPQALQFVEQKQPGMGAYISQRYQQALASYDQVKKAYDDKLNAAARQIVLDEVKNVKIGRYGLTVSQSPHTPTARLANFAELVEIDKARPGQIPLTAILRASDLNDKEMLIDEIQKSQQGAR